MWFFTWELASLLSPNMLFLSRNGSLRYHIRETAFIPWLWNAGNIRQVITRRRSLSPPKIIRTLGRSVERIITHYKRYVDINTPLWSNLREKYYKTEIKLRSSKNRKEAVMWRHRKRGLSFPTRNKRDYCSFALTSHGYELFSL